MNNKEYHQIKRGSKKRQYSKKGSTPRKAMVSAKDSRRAFKVKFESMMIEG